ncbi:MAG: Ig domain-containing protein [Vicinamibacterales bacterium]
MNRAYLRRHDDRRGQRPADLRAHDRAPGGMTIVAGTGVIAWTPSTAGTFPVVVSVSDGRGGSATQGFSIVVPQRTAESRADVRRAR